jgi:pantoate--beta-alanine ligase
MDEYRTVRELRGALDEVRCVGKRVGMVGTSGALHEGHLSLVRRSAAENDVTVMYWGGGASFEWMSSRIDYARDYARDMKLAREAGLDAVFAPHAEELFAREPMTRVSLPAMSAGLPGLEDPAHLDLIAMVMCKLWNMFGPCRSYSGEKDWQQLAMFKRLADDLCFPIEVIGCPTVRHPDGLAVSSRNGQLSADERERAPGLYRALCAARAAAAAGERSSRAVAKVFHDALGGCGEVLYFTAVQADSMAPLETLAGSVRFLASVRIGSVRLVDNVGVAAGG